MGISDKDWIAIRQKMRSPEGIVMKTPVNGADDAAYYVDTGIRRTKTGGFIFGDREKPNSANVYSDNVYSDIVLEFD